MYWGVCVGGVSVCMYWGRECVCVLGVCVYWGRECVYWGRECVKVCVYTSVCIRVVCV